MADMEIVSCGYPLVIPDIYAGDFDEEAPVREQLWKPQPDEVVLDIGCSLGTYTLPALAAGAFVLAVDCLHVDPLVAMAHENGLNRRLIALADTLAADTYGYPAWLTDAISFDGTSYPEVLDEGKNWTTIDNLVLEYKLSRVDWIKVDTEGGELPVLRGALGTLQRWHPKLVIEEHSHMPHVRAARAGDQLHGYLFELGYEIRRFPYHNREHWFCEAVNGR